MLTSEHII